MSNQFNPWVEVPVGGRSIEQLLDRMEEIGITSNREAQSVLTTLSRPEQRKITEKPRLVRFVQAQVRDLGSPDGEYFERAVGLVGKNAGRRCMLEDILTLSNHLAIRGDDGAILFAAHVVDMGGDPFTFHYKRNHGDSSLVAHMIPAHEGLRLRGDSSLVFPLC